MGRLDLPDLYRDEDVGSLKKSARSSGGSHAAYSTRAALERPCSGLTGCASRIADLQSGMGAGFGGSHRARAGRTS